MTITTMGTSHGDPTYCRFQSSSVLQMDDGTAYLIDAKVLPTIDPFYQDEHISVETLPTRHVFNPDNPHPSYSFIISALPFPAQLAFDGDRFEV